VTAGGSAVSVNAGVPGSGAFASLDAASGELWVTLNRTVATATAFTIAAP